MIKFEKRKIESFILNKDYYINSFNNGNKDHVCKELAELYFYDPSILLQIYAELPKNIGNMVANSKYMLYAAVMLNQERLNR